MGAVTGFVRFWYDFIIGDDWLVAVVVAITLAALILLKQTGLWWVLPVVVVLVLGASLWRATR